MEFERTVQALGLYTYSFFRLLDIIWSPRFQPTNFFGWIFRWISKPPPSKTTAMGWVTRSIFWGGLDIQTTKLSILEKRKWCAQTTHGKRKRMWRLTLNFRKKTGPTADALVSEVRTTEIGNMAVGRMLDLQVGERMQKNVGVKESQWGSTQDFPRRSNPRLWKLIRNMVTSTENQKQL